MTPKKSSKAALLAFLVLMFAFVHQQWASGTAYGKTVAISLYYQPDESGVSRTFTLGMPQVYKVLKESPLIGLNNVFFPKKQIKDKQGFQKAVRVLCDGDVLYINCHGGIVERKHANGAVTKEQGLGLGEGLLYPDEIGKAFEGKRPRLLMVVIDACMNNAQEKHFDIFKRAFGAEVVLGWRTGTNSWNHICSMVTMMQRLLHKGSGGRYAKLTENPGEGTGAEESGIPFLYPKEYYGWTLDEIRAEIKDTSFPFIGGCWEGNLKMIKAPEHKKSKWEGRIRPMKGIAFRIEQLRGSRKVDLDFHGQITYGGFVARIQRKSSELFKYRAGAPGLSNLPNKVTVARYRLIQPDEEKRNDKWVRTSNVVKAELDLYHRGFGKNNDRMMEVFLRQDSKGIWESRGVLRLRRR